MIKITNKALVLAYTLLALASAFAKENPADKDYWNNLKKEREEYLKTLVDPAQSPLVYVEKHTLSNGTYSFGSAADNNLVLSVGPPHVGSMEVTTEKAIIKLLPDTETKFSDSETRATELDLTDKSRKQILIKSGKKIEFQVGYGDTGILRLLVKDKDAVMRAVANGFKPKMFDIDPSWRMEAQFEKHKENKKMLVPFSLGDTRELFNPGVLVVTKNGNNFRLEAFSQGPEMDGSENLFIGFSDQTNGKKTYGGGRLLDIVKLPAGWKDGEKLTIDFNKAANPYCALSELFSCMLPPPENRLKIAVPAGEKYDKKWAEKYRSTITQKPKYSAESKSL